jgi:hypothetical protein
VKYEGREGCFRPINQIEYHAGKIIIPHTSSGVGRSVRSPYPAIASGGEVSKFSAILLCSVEQVSRFIASVSPTQSRKGRDSIPRPQRRSEVDTPLSDLSHGVTSRPVYKMSYVPRPSYETTNSNSSAYNGEDDESDTVSQIPSSV